MAKKAKGSSPLLKTGNTSADPGDGKVYSKEAKLQSENERPAIKSAIEAISDVYNGTGQQMRRPKPRRQQFTQGYWHERYQHPDNLIGDTEGLTSRKKN